MSTTVEVVARYRRKIEVVFDAPIEYRAERKGAAKVKSPLDMPVTDEPEVIEEVTEEVTEEAEDEAEDIEGVHYVMVTPLHVGVITGFVYMDELPAEIEPDYIDGRGCIPITCWLKRDGTPSVLPTPFELPRAIIATWCEAHPQWWVPTSEVSDV